MGIISEFKQEDIKYVCTGKALYRVVWRGNEMQLSQVGKKHSIRVMSNQPYTYADSAIEVEDIWQVVHRMTFLKEVTHVNQH